MRYLWTKAWDLSCRCNVSKVLFRTIFSRYVLSAKYGGLFKIAAKVNVRNILWVDWISCIFTPIQAAPVSAGLPWWLDKQHSEGISSKGGICARTGERQADIVLSHTCPIRYEPWEVFLPRVDQGSADKFTEEWLGQSEFKLYYKCWIAAIIIHRRKLISRSLCLRITRCSQKIFEVNGAEHPESEKRLR